MSSLTNFQIYGELTDGGVVIEILGDGLKFHISQEEDIFYKVRYFKQKENKEEYIWVLADIRPFTALEYVFDWVNKIGRKEDDKHI